MMAYATESCICSIRAQWGDGVQYIVPRIKSNFAVYTVFCYNLANADFGLAPNRCDATIWAQDKLACRMYVTQPLCVEINMFANVPRNYDK